MIRAYDKTYLEKGRISLARMLDFAVYDLNYDLTAFFDLFIKSDVAARFERGESSIIAGKSGVELAYLLLEEAGIPFERVKPGYSTGRSKEYWAGHSLAYYQWKTSLSFGKIAMYVPITAVLALYTPYHEMDIRQFTDKMDELYLRARPDTNLKLMRNQAGLSQRELAERSGISLRTIQQYEQGRKNINKAAVESVLSLSRVLHCTSEDLLENIPIIRQS